MDRHLKLKGEQMKKHLFLILIMTLIVMSLAAQSIAAIPLIAGIFPPLIQVMAPLIVMIATPLIVRLFRKMGIELNENTIEPILIHIMELIAAVEENKKELSGTQKKALVTDMLNNTLSPKDQALIIKRYGSLETAVQAAFEKSSTSLK